MKPLSPGSIGQLTQETWAFYCKHSVLTSVSLWLLGVPLYAMQLVDRIMGSNSLFPNSALQTFLTENDPAGISYFLLFIIFTVLLHWGIASVFIVARRLLGHPAGRTRTSFTSVRKESLPYMFPLFFTLLLRDCITFFWSLTFTIPLLLLALSGFCEQEIFSVVQLAVRGDASFPQAVMQLISHCPVLLLFIPLMIPAVVYFFKTSYVGVTVTAEDLSYHQGLKRSRKAIHGHTWAAVGLFVVTAMIFQLPAVVISSIIDALFTAFASRFIIVSDFLGSLVLGFGMTLFLVAQTIVYERLRQPLEKNT